MNDSIDEAPPNAPPRASMLVKLTDATAERIHQMSAPPSNRTSSPEHTRQSLMMILAMAGTVIAGYMAVTMSGASIPRVLFAAIAAGWFAMMIHAGRGATPSR